MLDLGRAVVPVKDIAAIPDGCRVLQRSADRSEGNRRREFVIERHRSLKDALDKASAFLVAHRREIENESIEWAKTVNLSMLDYEFFGLKDHAATLNPVTVIGATRRGSNWYIQIRGPNKDVVVVTLDNAYFLLETHRVP